MILDCFFKAKFRTKEILLNLRQAEWRGIRIGDCVCNSYLRNYRDILQLDWRMVKLVYQTISKLTIWDNILLRIPAENKLKLFFIPEIVYFDEALRRFLLKKNFYELRQNQTDGRLFVEKNRLIGPQIGLSYYLSKKVNKKKIKLAKKILTQYVLRKKSYTPKSQFGSDININSHLSNSCRMEKAAVLFLHMVSDAQYYFGPSCFVDLHDWLMTSLRICQKEGLKLILKPHPACFNKDLLLPVDQMYLKRLENLFGIKLQQINPGSLSPSKLKNVHFAHPQLSPVALIKKIPHILFLTHHGTIASEAAFFGKTTIASSAGPYPKNAKFVHLFNTVHEYENLIRLWKEGRLQHPVSAKNSLWRWVASRRLQIEEKGHYFWFLLKKYRKKWNIENPWTFHLELEKRARDPKVYNQLVREISSLIKMPNLKGIRSEIGN